MIFYAIFNKRKIDQRSSETQKKKRKIIEYFRYNEWKKHEQIEIVFSSSRFK